MEVNDLTDYAEAALQGDAVSVPDTIYSGLQEAGWFSADPKIDADPEIAMKAQSLLQLVKEFSVSPSGKWEMALVYREIESIASGYWCPNCFTPVSRMTDDEWEERMQKLEARVGPRPEGSDRSCRCPVCGGGLGYQGIVEAEQPTGPESFTPEQQALIEEFFQGIYVPQDLTIEELADAGSQ
jgi:hypothetical protein